MVGEGVVVQGMRGYTVPPHAPPVACLTMSLTQHIWLKKKYHRVPTFNPVGSEATRLSYIYVYTYICIYECMHACMHVCLYLIKHVVEHTQDM